MRLQFPGSARSSIRNGAPQVVRHVLVFSIALALVGLAVALMFGKPPRAGQGADRAASAQVH